MMRNWRVEDNLVTLYIALHEYKDLNYKLEEIEEIISLAEVHMRIENFKAINGKGKFDAGGPAQSWKDLYNIFKDFNQKKFAELVNLILKIKSNLTKH